MLNLQNIDKNCVKSLIQSLLKNLPRFPSSNFHVKFLDLVFMNLDVIEDLPKIAQHIAQNFDVQPPEVKLASLRLMAKIYCQKVEPPKDQEEIVQCTNDLFELAEKEEDITVRESAIIYWRFVSLGKQIPEVKLIKNYYADRKSEKFQQIGLSDMLNLSSIYMQPAPTFTKVSKNTKNELKIEMREKEPIVEPVNFENLIEFD